MSGLESSYCYVLLMLIVTAVHCNQKNFYSYSPTDFIEYGTHISNFSLSCINENGTSFCPPWMYCDNGICRCGDIPYSILRCDDNWPGKVSVLDCYCLTYSEEKGITELGNCIFNCAGKDNNIVVNKDPIYRYLPMNIFKLNDFMCRGNIFYREGTLCGRCKDTFYPKANSFDMKCIKCGNRGINWLKYMLVCFVLYSALLSYSSK